MAQTVGNKLPEHEERNDKQEKVLTTMYTEVQKIIHGLVLSREETKQNNKELLAMGHKLKELEANVRSDYTEPTTQKESMVRAQRPEIPYFGELK